MVETALLGWRDRVNTLDSHANSRTSARRTASAHRHAHGTATAPVCRSHWAVRRCLELLRRRDARNVRMWRRGAGSLLHARRGCWRGRGRARLPHPSHRLRLHKHVAVHAAGAAAAARATAAALRQMRALARHFKVTTGLQKGGEKSGSGKLCVAPVSTENGFEYAQQQWHWHCMLHWSPQRGYTHYTNNHTHASTHTRTHAVNTHTTDRNTTTSLRRLAGSLQLGVEPAEE